MWKFKFFAVPRSHKSAFLSHVCLFLHICWTAQQFCSKTALHYIEKRFACQSRGIAVSEPQTCQAGAAVRSGITVGRPQQMEKVNTSGRRKFTNPRTFAFQGGWGGWGGCVERQNIQFKANWWSLYQGTDWTGFVYAWSKVCGFLPCKRLTEERMMRQTARM